MASGCSGSTSSGGGGPNCSSFTACGGSVVGTWSFSKACLNGITNPLAQYCPSSTFSLSDTISGSFTFQANNMYSTTMTSDMVAEDLGVPTSCLNGQTCAQLQTNIQMALTSGTASCASSATGCSCLVTNSTSTTSENGTYATSGDTITLTPANGTPGSPTQYCVQGNTLLVQTGSANPDAGTPGIVLAATKQ
jgi:hypothetical protein